MNLQLDRDNEQISGRLLDTLKVTNLQEFLNLPKPGDNWTDEQWAYHKRVTFISRIFAVVALLETVKTIGWVEHTCDWDLGITLTFKDGTQWQSEHGTETMEFKLDDGEILPYSDQRLATTNSIEKLVIHSFELDDGDYHEVLREFPIMDIDGIQIWD